MGFVNKGGSNYAYLGGVWVELATYTNDTSEPVKIESYTRIMATCDGKFDFEDAQSYSIYGYEGYGNPLKVTIMIDKNSSYAATQTVSKVLPVNGAWPPRSQGASYTFTFSDSPIIQPGESAVIYWDGGEGFAAGSILSTGDGGSGTVKEYVTTRTLTLNTTTGIESFTGAGTYNNGDTATTVCTAAPGYTVHRYEGTNSTGTGTETWYTSGSPQVDTDTWTMGADRTITAYATPWVHTVAYNANGGSGAPSSQTKTCGYELTLSSVEPDRTGYTFLGWSSSASATDAEYTAGGQYTRDQNGGTYTLYAVWEKNEHSVNLYRGTGIASVSGSGSYNYGDSVTVNATPSSGYTFSNWSGTYSSNSATFGFSMPDNDVSLTANASVINYSISYDLDGGSVASSNPTSYNVTTNSFTLSNPTKEGYAFAGWTGSNGTVPSTSVTIAKGSTGNRSYKANWTENSYPYRVNHYLMNVSGSGYTLDKTDKGTAEYGSTVVGVISDYGAGFTSPQSPQSIIIDTSEANNVINYYYTRNKFSVSLAQGTGIESVSGAGSYYYGARVELNAVVSTGYTWSKWTGTYESATKAYVIAEMPAHNVSMTAIATIITYPVNYYPNGGTGGPSSQTKTYGQNLTLSASRPNAKKYIITFNPSGGSVSSTSKQVECSFSMWNTQPNGSGKNYASSSIYSDNAALNLYAQWTNNAIEALPTPTRSNCEFVGWYTASSGGVLISEDYVVSENVTLYARWRYKIEYKPTGGYFVVDTDSEGTGTSSGLTEVVEWKGHDEGYTILDVQPEKAGSTFREWNTKEDGSGVAYTPGSPYTSNSPLTLFAQWSVSTYTVVFEPRGGTWSDGSTLSKAFQVAHGESVNNVPDISNGNKQLVGWTDSYENVTSDRTLYAIWDRTPIWVVVANSDGSRKWVKFF